MDAELIWQRKMPPAAKLILLYFALHPTADGRPSAPNLSVVARECGGMTPSYLHRSLRWLMTRGVLEQGVAPGLFALPTMLIRLSPTAARD